MGSPTEVPDPKKKRGCSSKFTGDLLDSLSNIDVQNAFGDIMKGAFLDYFSKLESIVTSQGKRISNLERDLSKAITEKNEAEKELQQLLQYTRRNAVRITNPAWLEPIRTPENSAVEDTDALVLQLAASLDVNLQPWEISRSHRVGKPRQGASPRPILVKFISYNARKRLYDARKTLKNRPDLRNVFINEDLTKANGKLAFEARKLKKDKVISETFTRDGRIYVRHRAQDRPVVVRDINHLQSFTSAQPYSNAVAQAGGPTVAANGDAEARSNHNDSTMSMSLLPLMAMAHQNINNVHMTLTTSSPILEDEPGGAAAALANEATSRSTNSNQLPDDSLSDTY